MILIVDAEFDSLLPTKLWCVGVIETNTSGDNLNETVYRFDQEGDFKRLVSRLQRAAVVVGHNYISFDHRNLARFLSGYNVKDVSVVDTLVVSRLFHYSREGGHSLDNWARYFGQLKTFVAVYDDASQIDLYCERVLNDCRINLLVYKHFCPNIWHPEKRFSKALRVEHDLAFVCNDMTANGFAFDRKRAEDLLAEITKEMETLEQQFAFSKRAVSVGTTRIRRRADGVVYSTLKNKFPEEPTSFGETDEEITLVEFVPFNPRSAIDRIDVLNAAGWRPVDKTNSHMKFSRIRPGDKWGTKQLTKEEFTEKKLRLQQYGWKVNEVNLATLPANAPEGARKLAEWLSLEGRRGDLEEWLAACSTPVSGAEVPRIHGRFKPIGAWTHRMAHSDPNQGNIFRPFHIEECKDRANPTAVESVKLRYNTRLRSLWVATPGRRLVGTDAAGIQMRVLAHYINDPEMIGAIENGNKASGTDEHSLNRKVLGEDICPSRNHAKTFIYAWVLGAGTGKVSDILGCSIRDAVQAVERFLTRYPGVAELKQQRIPTDYGRGYFIGLDGRPVKFNCPEHAALAGYLQCGEKVVMAHACLLWRKEFRAAGIPFWQVDFVHDEWQTEVPDDDSVVAEAKRIQCWSIQQTGRDLGLNVRLDGESKHGYNWAETH